MINIQDTTARFKSIFNNVCKILNEYHKKMAIDTINELFSKLSSNQTTIMVCGEFKRGKSTFINALLDMSLCPTDEHIATSTVSDSISYFLLSYAPIHWIWLLSGFPHSS